MLVGLDYVGMSERPALDPLKRVEDFANLARVDFHAEERVGGPTHRSGERVRDREVLCIGQQTGKIHRHGHRVQDGMHDTRFTITHGDDCKPPAAEEATFE
jgi:hypothetical protein